MEFYGNYQVYSESGVDLTLLRENLRRSVEERLEQNVRLLPLLEALRASKNTKCLKSTIVELDAAALLRHFTTYKVEFILIGGLAMLAHGSAFTTQDLAVCYSRNPNNIASLASALDPLHPYLRGAPPGLPFRWDVPTIQAGLNFALTTDLGDLDLLGEVSGIGGYDQAVLQSEERTIYDLTIRILTLDGLIAAKRSAGRAKDLGHVLELEELKKIRDAQS